MNTYFVQKNKGYSLVEVLIAITVLLIALVGPLTIASKGLQSAYYAREKATALYLAQEGMEMVSALRNNAYLIQLNNDNPDYSDMWIDNLPVDATVCHEVNGCGFDSYGTLFTDDPIPCGSDGAACRLQLDDGNNQARYSLSGSDGDSIYTRVIWIIPRAGETAYDVTVRVSWETPLFADQSVELQSVTYHYLEELGDL